MLVHGRRRLLRQLVLAQAQARANPGVRGAELLPRRQLLARARPALSTTSGASASASKASSASAAGADAGDQQKDGKQEENNEEKKEEKKEKKKEDHGLPWGLFAVLGFVGTIAGYFYRGSRNSKELKRAQARIQEMAALAPEEVEEIRERNDLKPLQFELLRSRIKARYPDGQARPLDFFDACGKLVGAGEPKALAAAHLFERLALTIADERRVPVLLSAMSMGVESSIEDRIGLLFRLFCDVPKSEEADAKMSHEQFLFLLEGLMVTSQLPIRCMVREKDKYPFNLYQSTSPRFLATRAVEELVKKRKDKKELLGYEENWAAALKRQLELADVKADAKAKAESQGQSQPEGVEAGMEGNEEAGEEVNEMEPVWTRQDFEDLMYTRAVCAWGECNTKSK